MTQSRLDFTVPPIVDEGLAFRSQPHFDGKTYDAALDQERLGAQLQRVRDLMADGQWRTLAEIEAVTGDPQASVSARIRDLRKPRFGRFRIERRRRGDEKRGLFEYRLVAEK